MGAATAGAGILVTGGAGYIGSHTCVALIENGFEPIIVDNLSNSNAEVLNRIAKISGHLPVLYQDDVRDAQGIRRIVTDHQISAVMHFAGLKSVRESVHRPLDYYSNNVAGSLSLAMVLRDIGIRKLVFSSSATVYGLADSVPIAESAPIRPINPYGETKAVVERIFRDLHESDRSWRIGVLRYFNPAGAHESGLIGEDPRGVPNNLMPYVSQVAAGRYDHVNVFGDTYPTPDGTGIRDYVHVMDLAEAHVAALRRLFRNAGTYTVNVGTGRGHSVVEVIDAFERATGRHVPRRVTRRREGDVAASYAEVGLSHELLHWRARRDLSQMCADAWRWQSANPMGYASASATTA